MLSESTVTRLFIFRPDFPLDFSLPSAWTIVLLAVDLGLEVPACIVTSEPGFTIARHNGSLRTGLITHSGCQLPGDRLHLSFLSQP
jgi:hypothetical protein